MVSLCLVTWNVFLVYNFSYHALDSCKSLLIFLCHFCKERECFFNQMRGYECVWYMVYGAVVWYMDVFTILAGDQVHVFYCYRCPYNNSVSPRTSFLALTGAPLFDALIYRSLCVAVFAP